MAHAESNGRAVTVELILTTVNTAAIGHSASHEAVCRFDTRTGQDVRGSIRRCPEQRRGEAAAPRRLHRPTASSRASAS